MSVVRELVDLVKQNERIVHLRLRDGVDNTSRHSSDIGLSVTSYICLVSDTAERHAHVLAVHRSRHRCGDRGLAHSGRSYKAYYLIFKIGTQLLDRKKFEYSFFYFLHTVVVCVEYLLCRRNTHTVFCGNTPRKLKTGVKIGANDRGFCRAERNLCQTVGFLFELFGNIFGQLCRGYLCKIFLYLAVSAVAKLVLNDLYLLAEVIFLLVSVQIISYFSMYTKLVFKHSRFALQEGHEQLDPLYGLVAFKYLLLVLVSHENVGGDEICKQGGSFYRPCGDKDIVADRGEKLYQRFNVGEHDPHIGFASQAVLVGHHNHL